VRDPGKEGRERGEDIARSAALGKLPFFDRTAVVALLDRLRTSDDAERGKWSAPLLMIHAACVLQERFGL
jgi:hypothetical protein